MKKAVITGVSGVLGQALARKYKSVGYEVVGVSRKPDFSSPDVDRVIVSPQESEEDAELILDEKPDILFLNAGQIEVEVGPNGEPEIPTAASMNKVNYLWPCDVAMAASKRQWDKTIEIIAIGSIADCCPSSFGPVYHSGKIAIHYFWTGTGPIIWFGSNKTIKMRLYRPGAIKSDLAWAPANRLKPDGKGMKMRRKRVDGAPDGNQVAERIYKWSLKENAWVGTYDEPISFRALKVLFSLAPNLFYKIQLLGWKNESRFGPGKP